ncbi:MULTISPECIES: HAD-IA family hydrolase [unclassified Polaromonas]|jgi:beta-phosphoglucomutase-like phosphatase (HAD superfamily)|uniref:HAD-IA family hydrolase n=1 Tax=unclassified Polaromonas TaxID=2638319 RepID=UPI000BCF6C34|nr:MULTISPECIES: HAD-IA family hydrolase [unclassified Polaromonas]OYY32593.1 MAG: protein CbbY [Polaromonas sp. 35-63-35]OYZ16225.1 MAG: protein CbbY [Polaromonas sp. 16-63-31]OYZ75896.1 MAG: protein CbbY [Polaromonas sp. 24-63-21]OZA47249.1 MAG: protein CbbY [Polaromonas sp. 17-63-33]OZA85343.1 MAG: protein CbbY [Polaromonas sp. 39-63-25]
MLQALIFDVDGTLADTESAHLAAFNQAFAEFGLDWHWDEPLYTDLLNISGGKERMLHYWKTTQPALREVEAMALQDTINRLHELKTAAYERAVNDGVVSLRPGVLRLMDEALADGLQMAIATTTSPANIAALLRRAVGPDWRLNFTAIGDASTAPVKKPDPQVYLQMLAALKLPPAQCLAFEDSGNGLQSATAAGLATLITPTRYTAHHDFSAAMRVVPDLSQVNLAQLRRWHGEQVRGGLARSR